MKLLHMADVHLGASYSGFGPLSAARAQEVLEAFRSIPERAAEARVDAVLLAGDLFDGPQPDRAVVAVARETLRRLVDLCIPVFIVPGTHDSITLKLNPYGELARGSRVVLQNGDRAGGERRWPIQDAAGRELGEKHSVYILARPSFTEPVTVQTNHGPLHVYGFAYDAAECRDPLTTFSRSSDPGVHVALLHAAVDGDGGGGEARGEHGLVVTPDRLAELDVDYIALGHDHRPGSAPTPDGLPVGSPGSFAATDLAEPGPRGFLIVELEPGEPPRVELQSSGVRPVAVSELDVGGFDSDDEVAAAAADLTGGETVPVIRLVGEPDFPLDADAVAAELARRFGHAAVADETVYFSSVRLDELGAADTVVGHVVRLGRERLSAAGTREDREVAQQALRVALRSLGVE